MEGDPTKHVRLRKEVQDTGITRCPLLSRLSLDFVNSLPYDPTHLCLLGWVKLLLTRFSGSDPRTKRLESSYVVSAETSNSINQILQNGAGGIPASWGRRPLEMMHLSLFKAEDFKMFGLFYGKVLFHGMRLLGKKKIKLWTLTSRMLQAVFDATPDAEEWIHLRDVVEHCHALFAEVFYVDSSHAFCFTPTTHAILHLPKMMKECGPLPNVSQFVVERLVGEIGVRVKSRLHPEANLFHKTSTLFALRLLDGGLEEPNSQKQDINPTGDRHSQNKCSLSGAGEPIRSGTVREADAAAHFQKSLTGAVKDLEVMQLARHRRARLLRDGIALDIEIRGEFRRRDRASPYHARQKCYIAAHFVDTDSRGIDAGGISPDSSDSLSSSPSDDMVTDTYYGVIDEIWDVKVSYKNGSDQVLEVSDVLARVDWFYGLHIDRASEVIYMKRQSANVQRTVESINCVDRLIGYMDIASRRYILDHNSSHIFGGQERKIQLKGVHKVT